MNFRDEFEAAAKQEWQPVLGCFNRMFNPKHHFNTVNKRRQRISIMNASSLSDEIDFSKAISKESKQDWLFANIASLIPFIPLCRYFGIE
jgi:hypothetical protein